MLILVSDCYQEFTAKFFVCNLKMLGALFELTLINIILIAAPLMASGKTRGPKPIAL